MHAISLSAERLSRLKVGYTARVVDLSEPMFLVNGAVPRRGDLIVARVSRLGQHQTLEQPGGRQATLYEGDEILVACGARYAPDQFEAELPDDLGPADLVAKGGVMAKVRARHSTMAAPTQIEPLGLLAGPTGRVRNLADYAIAPPIEVVPNPPTIAVVGTSMNSGKTTTVASIVRGLSLAGLRVGAAKLTGTGSGGDPWLFRDSGAIEALDFVDAGHPTTYRVPMDELVPAANALYGRLVSLGVDAIVLEIADGIMQAETSQLVQHPSLRSMIDAYVFAAGDSSGAVFGVDRLRDWGLTVLAASGMITRSPLGMREAGMELDIPVYTPSDLASPEIAMSLHDRARGITVVESAIHVGQAA
ncbi:DUF1611 domain-containing protein [Stackebrandtia soli]|uniref:DUF1611 domain-containing protein n=1 Tax=Stackebrandtia soli TaxID=1892856 RepID=UPI0039EA7A10